MKPPCTGITIDPLYNLVRTQPFRWIISIAKVADVVPNLFYPHSLGLSLLHVDRSTPFLGSNHRLCGSFWATTQCVVLSGSFASPERFV